MLFRLIEETIGDGKWYRRQRQKMESDRPPLSDREFLQIMGSDAADEHLWLAVRRAVAKSVGVPAEAVYPEDQLSDLWRMQLLGPDDLDVTFRLEQILDFKIPCSNLNRFNEPGSFEEFAEETVRKLRNLNS